MKRADWYLQKADGGLRRQRRHHFETLFAPRLEKISQRTHDDRLSCLNRDVGPGSDCHFVPFRALLLLSSAPYIPRFAPYGFVRRGAHLRRRGCKMSLNSAQNLAKESKARD